MSWIVFDCPSGISGDMTLGALVDLGVPLESIRAALATLPLEGWLMRAESVTRNSIAATQVHVELQAVDHSHPHAPGGAAEHSHVHESGKAVEHSHAHAPGQAPEHTHPHASGQAHEHSHAPERVPASTVSSSGKQSHSHSHEPHRQLGDVLAILQAGKLAPRALAWATEVFRQLAIAEAEVHRMPIEAVHFHEVGAVDAIVDIAGACVGLDILCESYGAQHIRVSQLRLGRGQVRTEHGMMPVPAPAVLRLLEGFPVQWSTTDGERVTPTGAAILAALASPLGNVPVRVLDTGYGAGSKQFADAPNVLRILVAEADEPVARPAVPIQSATAANRAAPASGAKPPARASGAQLPAPASRVHPPAPASGAPPPAPATGADAGLAASPHVHRGRVAVLSTTVDDMVPEFFGHLMSRLFDAGALDVYYTPVQMKKARPGTLVTVIARPEDAERLAAEVLNESTTLGVRIAYEERFELERRQAEVRTPHGRVVVKIAVRPDGTSRAIPEYESVRALAAAAGVPITDIYRAALQAAADDLDS